MYSPARECIKSDRETDRIREDNFFMQVETGAVVTGKVTGITKYGAFVELEDKKTGMVHISEVAPVYVNQISDYLSVGQEVKVKVLDIAADGKIALSIKKVDDDRPKTRSPRNAGSSGDRSASWQNGRQASEPKNFDDMLSRYLSSSEERLSSIDRGERRSSRRSSGSRNRNVYYDD